MPRTRGSVAVKSRSQSLAIPGLSPHDLKTHRDIPTLNRLRELITDQDVDDVMAMLREGLRATTNVPAPNPDGSPRKLGEPVQRALMPDWGARICCGRIMFAYKFGLPPKHHEITIHQPGPDSPGATPQEHFRELMQEGLDLKNVLETWIGEMKQAEPVPVAPAEAPAGPQEAEKAPETAQTPEEVPVLDV